MNITALTLASFSSLIVCTVVNAAPIFSDPQGDLFGGNPVLHDISSLESEINSDSVVFRITFFNPIAPPSALAANSVIGFIDIDVDRNASTGAISKKSQFSPMGPTDLGTELFVNLATERLTPGAAHVFDSVTNLPVGSAVIFVSDRLMEIAVPRSLLGGDTIVNYGVIVGGFIDVSDEAPNFGQGVASTIPEPSSLGLMCLASISLLLGRRRILLTLS